MSVLRDLCKMVIEAICIMLIILFVWNVIIVPMFLTSPVTVTTAAVWGVVLTLLETAAEGIANK